jgi:hypothetical protein
MVQQLGREGQLLASRENDELAAVNKRIPHAPRIAAAKPTQQAMVTHSVVTARPMPEPSATPIPHPCTGDDFASERVEQVENANYRATTKTWVYRVTLYWDQANRFFRPAHYDILSGLDPRYPSIAGPINSMQFPGDWPVLRPCVPTGDQVTLTVHITEIDGPPPTPTPDGQAVTPPP